jgi:hypothetical protein
MKMKNELNKLIESLSSVLADGIVTHLRSLVNAGEFKVALEELCAYIGEAEHRVLPEDLEIIEQIGNELGVDASWWKAIPRA